METKYHSTDAYVITDHSNENLINALRDKGYCVFKHGYDETAKWYLNISCDCYRTRLEKYYEDISSFTDKAKEEWDKAKKKALLIGFDAGDQPFCFNSYIPEEIIKKLSKIDVGISLSIYTGRDND